MQGYLAYLTSILCFFRQDFSFGKELKSPRGFSKYWIFPAFLVDVDWNWLFLIEESALFDIFLSTENLPVGFLLADWFTDGRWIWLESCRCHRPFDTDHSLSLQNGLLGLPQRPNEVAPVKRPLMKTFYCLFLSMKFGNIICLRKSSACSGRMLSNHGFDNHSPFS